jgi:hypothetical protein
MGALGEQTDMKTLWILAAVATLAACHSRSEDEVGAAPDRGDTTSVTADTSITDTTGGVTAQPGDTAAVVAPDTSTQYPAPPAADTTTGAVPSETPSDTSTIVPDTSTYQPGAGVDTTQAAPGATGYDTTGATGVTPDTGMAAPGADTTSHETLPSDSAAQSPSP